MSMFSALTFGARPFDLEATLASWDTSAPDHAVPEFKGKPKRKDDLSVEAWLTLVEQACSARRVPRTHWPAIAVHFMGKKPRGRVAEVEKVMRALHGEQWAWTWKSFSAAVLNMGWNIDEKKTREVHVESKGSGLWKLVKGAVEATAPSTPPATPAKSGHSSGSKTPTSSPLKRAATLTKGSTPSKPAGPAPTFSILPVPKPKDTPKKDKKDDKKTEKKDEKRKDDKKDEKEKKDVSRPAPARQGSLFTLPALPFLRPAAPQPAPSALARVSAQVPLWLIAAMEAIAVVADENPDVLTAIATALVAVGSVAAGGSAAVAAIGEAAYVVGRALKSAHERHQGHGHGH